MDKDSWKILLPFLRPIEPYLQDDEVSEIMVNPGGNVFIERYGAIDGPVAVLEPAKLDVAVMQIARQLQQEVSKKQPLLNGRLADGSRVAAVYNPVSVGGTSLSIRKFRSQVFTPDELIRRGMIPADMMEYLRAQIRLRNTILISGGTGSGKTTLLNAFATFLPANERIILIEDTSEIALSAPNVVRLEARREQGDLQEVTIRDLVRHSLRMRPDRIILGEVRGPEAFDLLQALNTGHQGTLSTIHANSATHSLSRFRSCIAMANMNIPDRAIARGISDAIQLVLHVTRHLCGTRAVTELLYVNHYDEATDQYDLTPWSDEEHKCQTLKPR